VRASAHVLEQSLFDSEGVLATRLGQHDGERIDRVPRQHVTRAQAFPQMSRDRAQQVVAGRGTESIVDRLEPVNGDHT
jgi:hypothetical protein